MSATALQTQVTSAVLGVKAQLSAAGTNTTATITRQDAAGVWQTIGTATPIYLSQQEPSRLARALQVAEVLRTTWALYGAAVAAVALSGGGAATLLTTLQVNDRVAWDANLTFLVTGIDTTKLAGAVVGTLEKVLSS